jgi:hypothetical protein
MGELNDEGMCRACGAARQINQISGNIIWVRNGRVVAAFQDEKNQWVEMAKRNGIPQDRWPERFQDKKE